MEHTEDQKVFCCEQNVYCVYSIRADWHYASRFRSVTIPSSFRQNGLCSHCPSCFTHLPEQHM